MDYQDAKILILWIRYDRLCLYMVGRGMGSLLFSFELRFGFIPVGGGSDFWDSFTGNGNILASLLGLVITPPLSIAFCCRNPCRVY